MASNKTPMPPSSPEPLTRPSAPDLSIGAGENVGIHPSGYVEPSTKRQDGDHSRELIETMARFRKSPFDFFREVSLHISGTGWRSYDKIIGTPIYYPGFSEQMKERVLQSPMLLDKIHELARRRVETEEKEGLLASLGGRDKRCHEIRANLLGVAEDMIEKMICKMESKRFLRGAYYLATQLLTRAYQHGIHVSSEEVLRLHAVAEEAAKKKQSIVFLPSHRSHVDYLSLQIICYRLGLGLPTVVAGDNLNIPLLGPFLQNAGAMWIRRSFGDDQLYRTVVQAYMDTLLQGGYNIECFIEGGRSRTGKLLPPKFGILTFILESVLSGRVEDVLVCPVSTQYDKVIEVDSYISELLGQPKKKENLTDFLSSGSGVLSMKLGRVDMRFHEPWSLRDYVNDQFRRYVGEPERVPTPDDWDQEKKVRLLRTMGYKVLSEINDVSVVMPSALCGTVLLTLRGRGVGKSELIRRVDWLRERITERGGRVAHFAGLPTEVVVGKALDVLGPELVGTLQNLAEETYYAVDRFQLSFYRNMTIHLFILEALVCAALYSKVKLGGALELQRMSYTQLRDQVFFLSQLFREEFIFPTRGLDANLEQALQSLSKDNVLDVHKDSEGKIETIELSMQERENGRENYDFFCFLIWPFIEASWLGAVSLMILTPPITHQGDLWLDMKKVQDQAQLLGKTLYHQGDLSYFEAVNKETLKNAYTRFEEEGIIIVTKSRDSKVGTSVRLADDWKPPRSSSGELLAEGKLWNFADLISQSRREGKNRRDGKTVSTRVLRLADLVGARLYEESVALSKRTGKEKVDARPSEEDAEEARRKERRRRIVGRSAKL
ncbi:uncharacterized protein PV09_07954 [Verruconis gallopava]|uniref:Phospholipid/glycerol acyltransferase domain-containing protein n=1 Tax=Verruconis gallopava TaxID=253628 RepID=A0A0D2AMS6_9PEZI|nr:uncharacterized protein PV09_07954 [Verruconis gallopava]KIW00424.1 hypothetical protein PV09_07954 [Verruconis gallopava]